MTLLYSSPVFLEHETGQHPERPDRLRRIVRHLAEQELDAKCRRPDITPVALERLARVHSREYVAEVDEFARKQGGYIEADTVVSPRSYDVALRAAGSVCDAV